MTTHPFVAELARKLRPGADERWLLPEDDAVAFERLLAGAPAGEVIVAAVVELALFATWLHGEGASPSTALRVFRALAPSLPRVQGDARAAHAVLAFDAVRDKSAHVTGAVIADRPADVVDRAQRTSPLDAFLASRKGRR